MIQTLLDADLAREREMERSSQRFWIFALASMIPIAIGSVCTPLVVAWWGVGTLVTMLVGGPFYLVFVVMGISYLFVVATLWIFLTHIAKTRLGWFE